MSSFVDRPTARGRDRIASRWRRLSPAVWSGRPVALQMAGTLALALVLAAVAWFGAPATTMQLVRLLGAAVHELGHAAGTLIQGGRVYEIVLQERGGHAVTSAPGHAAPALAGPLAVPVIATAVTVSALCRWGVQVWLAAFGIGLIALGIGTENLAVRWSLLPCSAVLCLAAIATTYEALRAAILMIVGFALAWATIDGLPYLATAEVMLADGRTSPSDTGQIAALLSVELVDVRDALVFAMVICAVIGACIVGRFIKIHTRHERRRP